MDGSAGRQCISSSGTMQHRCHDANDDSLWHYPIVLEQQQQPLLLWMSFDGWFILAAVVVVVEVAVFVSLSLFHTRDGTLKSN